MTTARVALERCAVLDRFTADAPRLQRTYLSEEHAAANAVVANWMSRAGLRTWQDAVGNLCGRHEGRAPGLPALALGSHLDTVPDAGSYDGMLGVMMAVAVAERLGESGRYVDLPFALEVMAFTDEEGTRFGTALLGSRALAGRWDDGWWDRRDGDGVTLRSAFTNFGLDPRRVSDAARQPDNLVGYLEAHIEQGPSLETKDRSLGYVTSIAGARRFQMSIFGEAGHAGGTPYSRRKDALVSASETILTIERMARSSGEDGCIATVGRIEAMPGAVNVIPGQADFTLDLRAATDAERDAMWDRMRSEIEFLCSARGTRLEVRETHRAAALPCAPWLRDAITEGIRRTGDGDPTGVWSKAGHDGMAIGEITDVGMLFLRCHDGISHQPEEGVRECDVAAGIDALETAVMEVACRYQARRRGRRFVPATTNGSGPEALHF